jgi:hypothetical protein
MVILGGIKPGTLGSDIFPTGKRYNPQLDRWLDVATNYAARSRAHHTAITEGTDVVIFGGTDYLQPWNLSSDAWRYRTASDSWEKISRGTPRARYHHTAVWTGSEMIIWGGFAGDLQSPDGESRGDGGRLNLTERSWKPVVPHLPGGIGESRGVWTGSGLIVAVGNEGASASDSLGYFKPDERSWKPFSPIFGRRGHSLIWTGSEVIFWGGANGFGYSNEGYTLTAIGRISRFISAFGGAPRARAYHSTVWTGTEMIIWGGFSGTGPRSDGARYLPSSNSWTKIQTNNAPQARGNHTAVWTGESMIVWGGDANGILPGRGGVYHPQDDSWETLYGPPSTTVHSAVWTGAEMLIWGGSTGGIPQRSGHAFRPGSRSWRSISLDSAPSPRVGHSAVWTGSEMIIWGGQDEQGEPLSDGARYNPVEDRWYPLSSAGPPPRSVHAAVWTGQSMLVWGGSGAGTFGDTWEYVPPGPRLTTTLSPDDSITFTWPASFADYKLQFTPTLVPPMWSHVPDLPARVESQWRVTTSFPSNSAGAYRLTRP